MAYKLKDGTEFLTVHTLVWGKGYPRRRPTRLVPQGHLPQVHVIKYKLIHPTTAISGVGPISVDFAALAWQSSVLGV